MRKIIILGFAVIGFVAMVQTGCAAMQRHYAVSCVDSDDGPTDQHQASLQNPLPGVYRLSRTTL
jgi:hypothetical protein